MDMLKWPQSLRPKLQSPISKGKKLRNWVVNVVEALPLSNKSGIAIPDIRNNNRSNRRRERKYQMI